MASNRGPDPRNEAIRALLTRSGNQCAFPGCTHPLINEKNQFIAQICHICAAAPGGSRYDRSMTDNERRSFANLILLCHRHHIETNDPIEFPASRLREIKGQHERQFTDRPFQASESTLAALQREADAYWRDVARANTADHIVPDLRIEIDTVASPDDLFNRTRQRLADLRCLHRTLWDSFEGLEQEITDRLRRLGYDTTAWEAQPYYENPTVNREWLTQAIGLPNTMTIVSVLLDQLELRCLEMAAAKDPSDSAVRRRLNTLREGMLNYAKSIGYVD